MNKLVISRHLEIRDYQEIIRFDIRSNIEQENKWACLKVKRSNEMVPYDTIEVEKEGIMNDVSTLIDLLKDYLYQIQRDI